MHSKCIRKCIKNAFIEMHLKCIRKCIQMHKNCKKYIEIHLKSKPIWHEKNSHALSNNTHKIITLFMPYMRPIRYFGLCSFGLTFHTAGSTAQASQFAQSWFGFQHWGKEGHAIKMWFYWVIVILKVLLIMTYCICYVISL